MSPSIYRSDDILAVDLGAYLSELIARLGDALGDCGRIELRCRADSVHLDLDVGIPCGLLVNEVVTNSLKHAFPNGATGTIEVEFRAEEAGRYRLIIEDDGVGLPGGSPGCAREPRYEARRGALPPARWNAGVAK